MKISNAINDSHLHSFTACKPVQLPVQLDSKGLLNKCVTHDKIGQQHTDVDQTPREVESKTGFFTL
jgi:hypothetical protein